MGRGQNRDNPQQATYPLEEDRVVLPRPDRFTAIAPHQRHHDPRSITSKSVGWSYEIECAVCVVWRRAPIRVSPRDTVTHHETRAVDYELSGEVYDRPSHSCTTALRVLHGVTRGTTAALPLFDAPALARGTCVALIRSWSRSCPDGWPHSKQERASSRRRA